MKTWHLLCLFIFLIFSLRRINASHCTWWYGLTWESWSRWSKKALIEACHHEQSKIIIAARFIKTFRHNKNELPPKSPNLSLLVTSSDTTWTIMYFNVSVLFLSSSIIIIAIIIIIIYLRRKDMKHREFFVCFWNGIVIFLIIDSFERFIDSRIVAPASLVTLCLW